MGDIFNAADYTVYVTEVAPPLGVGGPWSGKGYLSILLPTGITSNVAVHFDNILINDCYELSKGRVETDFDPNKPLLDADDFITTFSSKKQALLDFLRYQYEGTAQDKQKLSDLLKDINAYKTEIQNSNEPQENKNFVIANTNVINTATSCLIGGSAGRVNGENCTPDKIATEIAQNIESNSSCQLFGLNERYIVLANRILTTVFVPSQNLKNIWIEIQSNFQDKLLKDSYTKELFPATAPVSLVQSFNTVLERVWHYRIAIDAFSSTNNFEDRLLGIGSNTEKGCYIKTIGESFLKKYEFFGILSAEISEFLTAAAGASIPPSLKPYTKNRIIKLANKAGNQIIRTLAEIAPNGIIPSNSRTNNLFHKWFDDLLPEELDLVLGNKKLKDALADRIRYSPNGQGGMHEWCMVCEIKTFKNWKVPMSEIHRFRTETIDLKGVNPITGEVFVHGGNSSGTFHNELRSMIQQSTSLTDFNIRLSKLVTRWQINPNLLPPLIK